MERRHLVGIFFICLYIGHDAGRANIPSSILHAPSDEGSDADPDTTVELEATSSLDPDLEVCGAQGVAFHCKKAGCRRQYIWLDTPTESCRLTEEYKLINNPAYFAKVEVHRLLENSEKFKGTACIIGSFSGSKHVHMYKCMRRMQQIMRLLRYINKLQTVASADLKHSAYEYVSSALFQDSMTIVSENIAAGFDKYESTFAGTGLQYGKSWHQLIKLKADKLARNESGHEEINDSIASEEATKITNAMLQMVGVELTKEQEVAIRSGALEQSMSSAQITDGSVRLLEDDISFSMLAGVIDEHALQDLSLDVVTNLKHELPLDPSTLLQYTSNISVSLHITDPLKWIYKHCSGWVVARVAWLVIYSLAVINGVVRAGLIFPLLFVSCVLLKFVKWVGLDMNSLLGYKVDSQPVIRGLKSIGHCPKQMWEAVGFDATQGGAGLALQIFVEPARFASDTTGVINWLYSRKKSCEDVRCGWKAFCEDGECFCRRGYYPSIAGSCALRTTDHGCSCKATWQASHAGDSEATYEAVGCPPILGYCEVDKSDSTWNLCQNLLPAEKAYRVTTYDGCLFGQIFAPVPSL